MPDAENAHGALVKGKQHAVVAEAKPEGAGHVTVECSHIAGRSG
jgi:hypothetical protein